MIGNLLSGLLWLTRLRLRAGTARAFAAHGYVDNAYRPPRLPFVSVVGPLSFNLEPEREVGRKAAAPVRVPGHVIGQPRALTDAVAAGGSLRLRLDGRASATLTPLPGGSFGSPDTGPALAAAIQARVQAAATGSGFADPAGQPITDPASVAALQQVTCRWDPESRRLAIVSGPGSPPPDGLSRVEVLPAAGSVAAALGLSPPERARDGLTYLHRLAPPRAITVDVQLNLWAASQQDLAAMLEDLAVVAPTRGNLLVRPSLLLEDAADGATSLRLLDEGEPTLAESLLHLEAQGGFVDRARGAVVTTSAGASEAAGAPPRLSFAGTGTATARLHPTPLVPTPLHAANPAPLGLAVSLGLRLQPGGANGQRIRVVSLEAGATVVFRLEVALTQVQGKLNADLDATATVLRAGAPVQLRTVFRVPIASVQADVGQVHAVVDAAAGAIFLWVNGDRHRPDDPAQTPTPPVTAPASATTAAADMLLTVGRGDQAIPLGFLLGNLHVVAAPLGALDPALRRSVTGASRLQPGDPIILVRSDDGVRPSGARFQAMAASVDGDVVQLARPLVGRWPRGRTVAYRDECFFFQTAVKRRDDLLNQLYRACIDYRVSAEIEDARALATAALVETANPEVVALGATRTRSDAPGVTAVVTDRPPPHAVP